jgi:hypothetical protein
MDTFVTPSNPTNQTKLKEEQVNYDTRGGNNSYGDLDYYNVYKNSYCSEEPSKRTEMKGPSDIGDILDRFKTKILHMSNQSDINATTQQNINT